MDVDPGEKIRPEAERRIRTVSRCIDVVSTAARPTQDLRLALRTPDTRHIFVSQQGGQLPSAVVGDMAQEQAVLVLEGNSEDEAGDVRLRLVCPPLVKGGEPQVRIVSHFDARTSSWTFPGQQKELPFRL